MDWTDDLPPPPREAYALIEQAREHGLWLIWARYAYHARRQGGRYKLTLPHDTRPLVASDDLSAIRQWLVGHPGGDRNS